MEVAEDQSNMEPLEDPKGNEDSHNDIMVDFVEGIGPVSHQVDDCCMLVGVVCLFENEVDDREKSMRARCSWYSIQDRIIVSGSSFVLKLRNIK